MGGVLHEMPASFPLIRSSFGEIGVSFSLIRVGGSDGARGHRDADALDEPEEGAGEGERDAANLEEDGEVDVGVFEGAADVDHDAAGGGGDEVDQAVAGGAVAFG